MGWMLKIPKSFRRRNRDCSSIQQNQVRQKHLAVLHCLAHPKYVCLTHTHTSFTACVFHMCKPDFPSGNSVLLSELWHHLEISETAEKKGEEKRNFNATRQKAVWECSYLLCQIPNPYY